jgi:uncharacterized membrane protein YhaH (DUF805 family)
MSFQTYNLSIPLSSKKEIKMNKAISSCMNKYATFSGRSSRSEYWFFYLFYIIVYIAGAIVGAVAGSSVVMYLFILPFVLPLFAAGVRRIHDVGKSGWFILVPIYNLVLMCTAGTKSANAYGEPVA